jgi:hypothetical protein
VSDGLAQPGQNTLYGLFLSSAGGLDHRFTPKLGRLGVLASGWFERGRLVGGHTAILAQAGAAAR